jgi:polysaccharide export outer membrane protein
MSQRAYKTYAHLLVVMAAMPVCAARGQAKNDSAVPPSQAMPAPNPQLKPNPLEALRQFEPAADEEYRLGKGDEITVDFAGRPDLEAKLVIGPDGRVTLPLAGELMLADLTREEAAKALERALSQYYSNLSVQVTVTRYTANRVLVLGAVEHPGSFTFDSTPTLLDALTRSGLPKTLANAIPDVPEQCAIYRGNNQVVWVQLKALIESGNPLADLRLRRDDVVYVPNMAENFVSVLGEVQHPGPVQLTHASTLASILAAAGGTSERAGMKPRIQVVDHVTGKSQMLTMDDVLNPAKSLEITLKPGDIVYVPRSGWYQATYVLERLAPFANLSTMFVWTTR